MLGAGGTCEFSSQTLRSDRRVAHVAPASARASGRLLPDTELHARGDAPSLVNARGSSGGRIRCHLVAGAEIVHCAGETLSGFRWLPAARMSAWQGRRTLASPRLPQGCRGHGWRCGRLSRNDDFVGDHHWLARRDASRCRQRGAGARRTSRTSGHHRASGDASRHSALNHGSTALAGVAAC